MGLLGVSGHGNVVDGENTVRLEDMKTEIKVMSLSSHVVMCFHSILFMFMLVVFSSGLYIGHKLPKIRLCVLDFQVNFYVLVSCGIASILRFRYKV